MKIARIILTLIIAFAPLLLYAQDENNARIEEQKRIIANLEKKIEQEEQEISKLKKGRASAQETARRLARQIDSRNQLLNAKTKQIRLLENDIRRTNGEAGKLSSSLSKQKSLYAKMVREAYRNYKHNNYLTYIFASKDFSDVARKITNLRGVAEMREIKMKQITSLSAKVSAEQELLTKRKQELDNEKRSLSSEKVKLQKDSKRARSTVNQLSKKEKEALRQRDMQQSRLDAAVNELRKLIKGNKEGNTFSTATSNLRLPVIGGRVKRYKGNMAEIIGPANAKVISIYEGKVVDIKRNKITNKYDIYVAHGEYITTYANLGSVCVEKDSKVARNGALGTIGSSVDVSTMETEYRLIFGIYAPSPDEKMKAENCFRK